MRQIVIDGVDHPVAVPSSMVERVELNEAVSALIRQPGASTRASALLLWGLCRSLRPSVNTTWTGSNAAELGRATMAHLMEMGLGPADIEEVVAAGYETGGDLFSFLRASLPPARGKVTATIKNS